MFKTLLFIGILITSISVFAQNVSYKLKMSKPQTHYFEVEMNISEIKDKEVEVKLPVWAPGSYLVREFSKNINLVKAFASNGKELKVQKSAKNKWVIASEGNSEISVKYEVYSFELSVRTSFLDLTHGFVSGPGVFMYIDQAKENKGTLEVFPYKDFKVVSTALPLIKENNKEISKTYQFDNYDQLLDCPIEIGNQEVFDFTAGGTLHTVAIYGKGNYNIATLKVDMAKICESATNVFGTNPNKNYTFIIHNVTDGQGGLEHVNSTTLSVNRWTYDASEYSNFLSLVAHEYFHLWNVKRIRPRELGPFNYDEENYTTLLWVMEGFTSYYDELLLVRAGYISGDEFLSKLNSSLNYVEGSVGSRVQPVAHSSFDAWIKGYRPNENSSNTGMTYYSRGSLLAALIDAMIIDKYEGKKCLDHFMQTLLEKYYKKEKRGFSDKEFQTELEVFLGQDLSVFFNDYVFGTKIPDYNLILNKIGVSADYVGQSKPSFGAALNQNGNQLLIKTIRSGSAAEEAGLSPNDEIIGCNGFRVDQGDLEAVISGLKVGQNLNLLISRDLVLYEIIVKMANFEKPQYRLSFTNDDKTFKNKSYWLRKQ